MRADYSKEAMNRNRQKMLPRTIVNAPFYARYFLKLGCLGKRSG